MSRFVLKDLLLSLVEYFNGVLFLTTNSRSHHESIAHFTLIVSGVGTVDEVEENRQE